LQLDGDGLTFAGRPVPALLDGDTLRVGIPDRLGHCVLYGMRACGRLLDQQARSIALVLGRAFGVAQQTWTEYQDAGGWQVLDLTLSDEPFDREAYLRAAHAVAGTRIPIPDDDTLLALYEITQAAPRGSWVETVAWTGMTRAEFLSYLASQERQKE
jgi:hypothetical protein